MAWHARAAFWRDVNIAAQEGARGEGHQIEARSRTSGMDCIQVSIGGALLQQAGP